MEFLSGYLEFLCKPGASFSRKFGIKRRPAFGDRMIGTAGVRFIDILNTITIRNNLFLLLENSLWP